MRSHNPLISFVLGAFAQMVAARARFQERFQSQFPTRPTGRCRTPGDRQPAGSKLLRKADERRLGLPSGRRGLLADR